MSIGENVMIAQAGPDQYESVRAFYHALIDAIALLPYGAGWKKDIYPSKEMLRDAAGAGELFIATDSGKIIGAMVVNHECNEGYREYKWPTEAEDSEVTVIHALGVHPDYSGKGVARQMVRFVIEKAGSEGQKVIRLDVLKGNLPAEKLYKRIGFKYLHTLNMFYEDTGWTDYELYEYPL